MDWNRIVLWGSVITTALVVIGAVLSGLKSGIIEHYQYETDMEIDESELRLHCPANAEMLIQNRRIRHKVNINNER